MGPDSCPKGDVVHNLSGRLTEVLFAAARGNESWETIGDLIFDALPGAASGFIRFDGGPDPYAMTSCMRHFRQSFIQPYEDYYAIRNPWGSAIRALGDGDVFNLQQLHPSCYQDSEFYHDFILGHGEIDGGSVFKLSGQSGSFLVLTVQYPSAMSERYDCILREVLSLSLPAFEEAMDLAAHKMQAWLDGACESALSVVDAQRQDGFIIDRFRRLEKATTGAVDILKRGRDIIHRNGRLQLENPEDDKWLSDSLRLLHHKAEERSVGRTLQIDGVFYKAALWRLPRPRKNLPSLISDRYALVLSNVQELDTHAGAREVARHYGLTPSETQVVSDLANDRTLSDIAERLQVSIHTIRSQIKSAMRKTECHRQSELVAKVYRFSN